MSVKQTVVLGGGFAGLSAALHLALEGREVTLLEQASSLGGKAGEYAEAGYRFDIGPSVWTLPHLVTDLFEKAGETPPVFKSLEPLCRYHFESGRIWDVYQKVEGTTAQLSAEEAQVYRNLLGEARKLYEAAAPTFLYGQAPGIADLARYGLRHGLKAYPTKKLPDLLGHFGARGRPQNVLPTLCHLLRRRPAPRPGGLAQHRVDGIGFRCVLSRGGYKRCRQSTLRVSSKNRCRNPDGDKSGTPRDPS